MRGRTSYLASAMRTAPSAFIPFRPPAWVSRKAEAESGQKTARMRSSRFEINESPRFAEVLGKAPGRTQGIVGGGLAEAEDGAQ